MSFEYFKSDIVFQVNGKEVSFSVVNNLPDTKGLSINDALQNWVHRTKSYTAKSFCKYVNSKNTGFTCITVDEYNSLE